MAETRFGTTGIPYYAIIRPDDTVVATFAGLTRNAREFASFLSQAPASS